MRYPVEKLIACFLLVGATSCGPETESSQSPSESDSAVSDSDAGVGDAGDTFGDSRADTTADAARDGQGSVTTCMDKPEECNGKDDNCNGVVDEGCGCQYQEIDRGVCSNATIGSEQGTCQTPEAFEADESSCDGKDNDCDGVVDEGCACPYGGSAQGVCQGSVVDAEDGSCKKPENFVSGREDGFTSSEHCDGLDNDCDGAVDEGCPCNYAETEQGVCSNGARQYTDGACGKPASYQAEETICDGKDNDCDGEVDETCTCRVGATEPCYTGPAGTEEVGICAPGTKDCFRTEDGDSEFGECQDETLPQGEICGDGIDNDCDGEVDESSSIVERFEGSDPGWTKFSNGSGSFNIKTDATQAYNGSEAARAKGSNQGVCGQGGIAKSFNFSQVPTSMTVWLKGESDNWGRVSIMLEDSSGVTTIWRRKSGGSPSMNFGWMKKTFDLTNHTSDSSFTLIFGNDDNSQHCSNFDHGWTLWIDDLTIEQPSCPGS